MKARHNDPDLFLANLLLCDTDLDRSKPLSEQIYQILRVAIVTMALQPADVIYERVIAETLGVSRTPIREALLQLAHEELVVIAAQSKTSVSPVGRDQFIEAALIRRVLESASIRRAALIITDRELEQLSDIQESHSRAIARNNTVDAIRNDNAFHATVSRAAHLPKVQQLIELAKVPIDRVRHVTAREPEEGALTLRQHQDVLDALAKHDPARAELALIEHLDDAHRRQLRVFEAHVALFEGNN